MHIGKQYFYLFVYSQLRVYIKCIRKYLFDYMFKIYIWMYVLYYIQYNAYLAS